MSDASPDKTIEAFYDRGHEQGRLARGDGELEFIRTQTILQRHLPKPPADVYDIGGGPGRYALWLAECGYRVHLVDPVVLHVEQARAASTQATCQLVAAEVGDARSLTFADKSADVVLLLGPLYHLQDRADRVQVLSEARRVCRPGGVIAAATISRFASTLDGLRGGYLADPVFAKIVEGDLRNGRHDNPTGHPAYFTTAYFHRAEDIADEFAAAGFAQTTTVGIEGAAWLLPNLDDWLADEARKAVLLSVLERIETEPALLGVTAHALTIARRT